MELLWTGQGCLYGICGQLGELEWLIALVTVLPWRSEHLKSTTWDEPSSPGGRALAGFAVADRGILM